METVGTRTRNQGNFTTNRSIMHDLKLNTKTITLADSIDELPIKLFNLANEFTMQDFEIGNDMNAVDRHEHRIEVLLVNNKLAEAIQVQKNKRMTYFSMLNKINYKSLTFACHIRKIDGMLVTDHTPENLIKMMDELSDDGLTMEMVKYELDILKKKLKFN
jgi:hypothetical protein